MSEPISTGDILENDFEKLKSETKMVFYCETCQKDTHRTEDHGKKGGARKGAGMPKGKLTRPKLEQMRVRDAYNQRVMLHADRLFNAQMALAVGEQALFVKTSTGEGKNRKTRTEMVTDPEIIKEYLDDDGVSLNNDSEDEYYFLSLKPANNMAIDSLLNRGLGKVPDKLEVTGGLFSQAEIVIKEIGSKHIDVDIGAGGQLIGGDDGEKTADGDSNEHTPDTSDETSEPPASS